MFKKQFTSILIAIAISMPLGGLLSAMPAQAWGYCFCGDDLSGANVNNLSQFNSTNCFIEVNQEDCDLSKGLNGTKKTAVCSFTTTDLAKCTEIKTQWDVDYNGIKKAAAGVQAARSQFIPECLFAAELPPECRDVSIFVSLGINVGRYLFGIIGALALLFFIYGGFILILSQGNSEKIKKGTGAIVAALIGLSIVFGAYILVGFLGSVIGIKTSLGL